MYRKSLVIRAAMAPVMLIVLAVLTTARAQAAEPQAVRSTILSGKGPLTVELVIDKRERATLRATGADGKKVKEIKLVTPAEVLPLLVDRRLAFLWPTLTNWAGPSLERLSARVLADSDAAFARGKKAYGNDVLPYWSGKAGARYERVLLLLQTGRAEQGLALLQQTVAKWTPQNSWDCDEQGGLINSLAGRLAERGRVDEADRLLAAAPQTLGPGSHLLSAMTSRGLILAHSGRYQEALTAADAASQAYEAYAKSIGGMLRTIPGSERYFAAIRGCALAGLGRTAEAQAALVPVLGAREPGSLLHEVPETNNEIRLRTYACLRDRPAFAREIVANIESDPIAPIGLVLMQPDVNSGYIDPALLNATRSDPQVVAALSSIVRSLPSEFVPLLRSLYY